MDENAGIRINRYLSEAGICSRREADRRIENGRITVRRGSDTFAAVPGTRVYEGDEVFADGEPVRLLKKRVNILYNKPRGIVCTGLASDKDSIIRAVGYDGYITYVGRLDKDSTGLVLLTDDGELNNRLAKAAEYHEKEYEVMVGRDITDSFLKAMRSGVPILDTVTRPCKVIKTGTRSFSITLTQGLNRQIRRMCGALGYSVTGLKRVRIQNLTADGLKEGTWRFLTDREIRDLRLSCGLRPEPGSGS